MVIFVREKNVETEQEETTKYPSAKMLLEVIQKEYDYEHNRYQSIQSKVGILLPLVGVIITVIPTYINFPIFKLNRELGYYIAFSLFIIFMVLSFIGLITSLILYTSVLSTKEYKRLDICRIDEEKSTYEEEETANALVEQYKEIVITYIEGNDRNVKLFRAGLIAMTFSIIVLTISGVLLYIIK